MKSKTDFQGRVLGNCNLGDMEGAKEYSRFVQSGFTECCRDYRLQNGVLIEDVDLKREREAGETAQAEKEELLDWFSWYDNQCMQYGRALRIGEDFDQDMTALDAEAKAKQVRLRILRRQEEST